MDWQSWVDEGLIVRDEEQKREAPDTVSQAWDVALRARQSYLAGDLDAADELLREVFLTATHALVQSEGFTPCVECDLKLARKAAEAYFGPSITGDLFDTVDVIDAGSDDTNHAVKRGVTASATYAAVVGSRLDL